LTDAELGGDLPIIRLVREQFPEKPNHYQSIWDGGVRTVLDLFQSSLSLTIGLGKGEEKPLWARPGPPPPIPVNSISRRKLAAKADGQKASKADEKKALQNAKTVANDAKKASDSAHKAWIDSEVASKKAAGALKKKFPTFQKYIPSDFQKGNATARKPPQPAIAKSSEEARATANRYSALSEDDDDASEDLGKTASPSPAENISAKPVAMPKAKQKAAKSAKTASIGRADTKAVAKDQQGTAPKDVVTSINPKNPSSGPISTNVAGAANKASADNESGPTVLSEKERVTNSAVTFRKDRDLSHAWSNSNEFDGGSCWFDSFLETLFAMFQHVRDECTVENLASCPDSTSCILSWMSARSALLACNIADLCDEEISNRINEINSKRDIALRTMYLKLLGPGPFKWHNPDQIFSEFMSKSRNIQSDFMLHFGNNRLCEGGNLDQTTSFCPTINLDAIQFVSHTMKTNRDNTIDAFAKLADSLEHCFDIARVEGSGSAREKKICRVRHNDSQFCGKDLHFLTSFSDDGFAKRFIRLLFTPKQGERYKLQPNNNTLHYNKKPNANATYKLVSLEMATGNHYFSILRGSKSSDEWLSFNGYARDGQGPLGCTKGVPCELPILEGAQDRLGRWVVFSATYALVDHTSPYPRPPRQKTQDELNQILADHALASIKVESDLESIEGQEKSPSPDAVSEIRMKRVKIGEMIATVVPMSGDNVCLHFKTSKTSLIGALRSNKFFALGVEYDVEFLDDDTDCFTNGSDVWCQIEIDRFNDAFGKLSPTQGHFWETVANAVASKTAQQCFNYYYEDDPELKYYTEYPPTRGALLGKFVRIQWTQSQTRVAQVAFIEGQQEADSHKCLELQFTDDNIKLVGIFDDESLIFRLGEAGTCHRFIEFVQEPQQRKRLSNTEVKKNPKKAKKKATTLKRKVPESSSDTTPAKSSSRSDEQESSDSDASDDDDSAPTGSIYGRWNNEGSWEVPYRTSPLRNHVKCNLIVRTESSSSMLTGNFMKGGKVVSGSYAPGSLVLHGFKERNAYVVEEREVMAHAFALESVVLTIELTTGSINIQVPSSKLKNASRFIKGKTVKKVVVRANDIVDDADKAALMNSTDVKRGKARVKTGDYDYVVVDVVVKEVRFSTTVRIGYYLAEQWDVVVPFRNLWPLQENSWNRLKENPDLFVWEELKLTFDGNCFSWHGKAANYSDWKRLHVNTGRCSSTSTSCELIPDECAFSVEVCDTLLSTMTTRIGIGKQKKGVLLEETLQLCAAGFRRRPVRVIDALARSIEEFAPLACHDPTGENCVPCAVACLFPEFKAALLANFPGPSDLVSWDLFRMFCNDHLRLSFKDLTVAFCDPNEVCRPFGRKSLLKNLLCSEKRLQVSSEANGLDGLLVFPTPSNRGGFVSNHCFAVSLRWSLIYDPYEECALALTAENLRRCSGCDGSVDDELSIRDIFGVKLR